MNLTPYVERLRDALLAAAELGGEDARTLAERLTANLDSATRLALLEALSDAANEITRELAPGSVDVRLRGHQVDFAVTSPPAEEPDDAPHAGPAAPAGGGALQITAEDTAAEDAGTARITLRLPEHLKPRVEAAARGAALSVNAWLVRAAADALGSTAQAPRQPSRHISPSGQRFRGWVR